MFALLRGFKNIFSTILLTQLINRTIDTKAFFSNCAGEASVAAELFPKFLCVKCRRVGSGGLGSGS